IKYQSINNTPRKEPECPTCETPILNSDRWIDKYNQTISEIKNQIEYDILVSTSDKTLIDNIVNIMAEVLLVDTPYYEIEGKKIDTELVRINYRKINFEMLDAFMIEYNKIRYKIKNSKYYLITALYNIPLTAAAALANRVQYDIYGVHNE
ncbi:MAG: DUF6017 domain-containing protein, partial [Bacteroidales bacterium]|nr:DUF6017 domain-containing protein [Bacteroidales bacterium]